MTNCLVCAALAMTLMGANALQTQPAPAKDPAKAVEMTLTGCVRSTPGETATTGVRSAVVYTVEVDAPIASAASAHGPHRVKHSLSADESIGLSKHVGHRVQLTGQLLQPPGAAPGITADPATGLRTKPLPEGTEGTFKVSGLKMLSAKCE